MDFAFVRLPVLVKNKIMRQYIPMLCKALTLYEIPEFLDVFGFDESWLHPSKTFFEFFESVRSLEPGLYLYDGDRYFHAIYVSMDQEKISFKICCLNIDLYDPLLDISNVKTTDQFYKSLSEITDFFTAFQKKNVLYDEKTMSLYKLKPYGYFFVNHSTDEVRWFDGRKKTLRKSCYGKVYHFAHLSLVLAKDRIVRIKCRNFWSDHCVCENRSSRLEPISIDRLLRCQNEKQTLDGKNALEFRIVGDERVLVTYTDVVKDICRFRMDLDLFNLFRK